MEEQNDNDVHLTVPRSVATLLLCAAGLGGAGAGVSLSPAIEESALRACYDNSQTALKVAAQHGEEIKNLETLILERTRSRWTEENHRTYQRAHDREHSLIEKRLEFLEKQHD